MYISHVYIYIYAYVYINIYLIRTRLVYIHYLLHMDWGILYQNGN